MHAFKQNGHRDVIDAGHANQEDDEDEERRKILSLCCFDGVIGQLHKQVKTVESYQGHCQGSVEARWGVQSKIVDM